MNTITKQKIRLLIFLWCTTFATSYAQKRVEINAGAGTLTLYNVTHPAGVVEKGINVTRRANYALHTSCKLYDKRRKNSMGIVLGYDRSLRVYDPYAGFNRRDVRKTFTIALEGMVQYSPPGKPFRVYGSFSLGHSFVENLTYYKDYEAVEHSSTVMMHITPLGFAYGKKYGCFAEVGLGYKGLVCAGAFVRL